MRSSSLFSTVLGVTMISSLFAMGACTTDTAAGTDSTGGTAGTAGSGGSSGAGAGGSAGTAAGTAGVAGTAGAAGTAGVAGSAGAGGSVAGAGGSAGSAGSSGSSGSAGSGGINTGEAYIRLAHLIPDPNQGAMDICVRSTGSTTWTSADATGPIFAGGGTPGEFYFPAVSTFFAVKNMGSYDFRVVSAKASDCNTQKDAARFPDQSLTLKTGDVLTLVYYGDPGATNCGAGCVVAFQQGASVPSQAHFTFANAMTNLSTSVDFFTDSSMSLSLGVAKYTNTQGNFDPFTKVVNIGKNGSTSTLVGTVTAMDAKANGVYTVYAAGVNETAFKTVKPTIIGCDDINDTAQTGSLISSSCIYGVMPLGSRFL